MKRLKHFFFIKKSKKDSGKLFHVYGNISYLDTKPVTYSTGVSISEKDWEKTKQLTKPKTQGEEDLSKELSRQKDRIKVIQIMLEDTEKAVSASIIKDILLGKDKKKIKQEIAPKHTLKGVMKELIADKVSLVKKGRRSEGTLSKYYTTEKHLDNFLQTQFGQTDIALDELNYKFVKDFYHFLLNDRMEDGRTAEGICNNTCQKYIQTMRCSIFFAIKMDYIYRDPFKMWEYEWDTVETVYLTKSELAQIENHKFENKRLQICADIFLFSSYTGFAPADLKKISWDTIELRDNGKYWFNISRQKTDIKCEVMMFKKTRALIDKYKDDPTCKEKNMLIPYRANQTMNEYLKEVAHHCGITKKLAHYVARHTFATTVMLGNGASLEVTKRALGHVRVTQTEHYAKIVDAKVTSEMERVDANLESDFGNYEDTARERDTANQKVTTDKNEIKIIQLKPSSKNVNKASEEITEDKKALYTRRKLANKRIG